MSTDMGINFDERYMNINTKLKKKFMRKPNIAEATNEFTALAIQCENSEQPEFAGQAYMGAAKCEAMAGNFLGEAEQYLAAARQFMKAEKKLRAMKFSSPDRENLEAAIGCYLQALGKYPEKSSLRTAILMELAERLKDLRLNREALHYYEQALELIEDKMRRLMHMRNLLNLQMDCGLFDVALQTANKIYDSNTDMPEEILIEIQVSRILLALTVDLGEDHKPDSLKQLFKVLMEDDCESDGLPFNPDLLLKLQSLTHACGAGDVPALTGVAADTRRFLTTHQTDLLDALLQRKRVEYCAFG